MLMGEAAHLSVDGQLLPKGSESGVQTAFVRLFI